MEEFKTTKAESILKQYINYYKLKDEPNLEIIRPRAEVALNVCERKIKDIDEIIDDENKFNLRLISKKEWDILSADELSEESLAKKKHDEWINNLDKNKEKPVKVKKKKVKKEKKATGEDENNKEAENDDEEEENE